MGELVSPGTAVPDLTCYSNCIDPSQLASGSNIYFSEIGLIVVEVTAGGSGYTTATTVTFTSSDGAGSGAAGTLTIEGGEVRQVVMTSHGSGYTSPPTVTLGTPDGTGA